jgi:hypothetical protein
MGLEPKKKKKKYDHLLISIPDPNRANDSRIGGENTTPKHTHTEICNEDEHEQKGYSWTNVEPLRTSGNKDKPRRDLRKGIVNPKGKAAPRGRCFSRIFLSKVLFGVRVSAGISCNKF